MAKQGKKFLAAAALVEKGKTYTITEAIALAKKASYVKFNETVTVSFNLGIDARQADQQIRGAMVLPHGTGKTKTVLAITRNEEAARNAGADFVGGKEMLDKIRTENWFGFDVIVRLLGPKGLMPNPKTGTVSPDIARAIAEVKAGKVTYRADKEGNMHVVAGQLSFDDEKLLENIKAVCNQVIKVKPQACKGVYIKNCVLSSTMGPSIKMNPESN